MSKSYSSLRNELIRTADDNEYRHAYEQRRMTQGELANEAGTKQSVISRYENANYSSWSIRTLRRLAKVFDVDLDVRFRSFGDLVESVDNFSRTALQVPKFTDDPFFKLEKPAAQPQRSAATLVNVAITPPTGHVSIAGGSAVSALIGSAASAASGYRTHSILTGSKTA